MRRKECFKAWVRGLEGGLGVERRVDRQTGEAMQVCGFYTTRSQLQVSGILGSLAQSFPMKEKYLTMGFYQSAGAMMNKAMGVAICEGAQTAITSCA